MKVWFLKLLICFATVAMTNTCMNLAIMHKLIKAHS